MGLLLETNVSCVSGFIQKAGIEALKGDQEPINNMMKEFRERRGIFVKGLNGLPGIHCLEPKGAFYVFPNIKNTGLTDIEFADYMLENAGVACVPGSIFGEDYKDYVRFCYASSKKDIIEAIDENKNLKYICTTQEQGAAIAAEAYSRITQNLGVAMATSGPGATNLITGIGCAYFDSIPVLYITGQVNTNESTWKDGPRQVGFQETDIVNIVKPITKFAVRVDNPEDIKYYLDKAIYLAKSGRP